MTCCEKCAATVFYAALILIGLAICASAGEAGIAGAIFVGVGSFGVGVFLH